MAYKATVNVACFKQHTCVECNSKFSYILQRQVTAEGANEQKATHNAEAQAVKALDTNVDYHPCPNCGAVQPEMMAIVKTRRCWWAIIAGILGLGAVLLLGFLEVLTIAMSAYIAAGVAVLVLLLAASSVFYNPNKDPDANRITSEAEMQAQSLFLDEKTNVRPGPVLETHSGGKTGQMVALLFLLAAVACALAPLGLAMVNGWVANDGCRPAVCGPGDTVRVYFDSKITSVKGYWNGSTTVRVLNAEDVGLAADATLSGKTKSDRWGNQISGDSVSESTKKMWVDVRMLDKPDLAGKMLRLYLTVNARYPCKLPGDFFDVENQTFEHKADIRLSAPRAGALYHKSWWMGQVAAIGIVIFSGIILQTANGALRRKGNPTAVAPIESGDDEPPDEVDEAGYSRPPST